MEVHVSNGLPGFTVVGLPDAACRESRDRVRAALLSSGLPWPLKRVTVNLAPSSVRKGGAGLDLPIAVGLLVASEELAAEAVAGCAFLGELGLDGSIRRVPGIVPLVAALSTPGGGRPARLLRRGQRWSGATRCGWPGRSSELLAALRGDAPWPDPPAPAPAPAPEPGPDLADVRGQAVGRTAVEVAAAGGHHLLLSGPPGAGKTMLARRLPGLLPPLEGDDAPDRHPHPLGRRRGPAAGRPGRAAAVPGAAPRGVVGGPDRRRHRVHAAGRDLPQPRRRPVPGRDGRVPGRRCSTRCASRWRRASSGCAGPGPACRSRPGSCWWAPPTRARAARAVPAGPCRCPLAARLRYSRRLSGPLLDRFDLRVVVSRPDAASVLRRAAGRVDGGGGRRGWRRRGRWPPSGACGATPSCRRPGSTSWRRWPRARPGCSSTGCGPGCSAPGACTGSGGWPAPSPTWAAPPAPVAEEHVCLALSLRAELAPAEAAA